MERAMIDFDGNNTVAVYGLGTETQRFLSEHGDELSVVGLLDGFRSDGEMYGYPIISLQQAAEKNIKLFIVVARPGSCKAIAKRIGDFCRENDIALFDVRGRNLLEVSAVAYDFKNIAADSRQRLQEMIDSSDVVSFDLFDTLVMRKTRNYTDVFELIDSRLKEQEVYIPDFSKHRLFSEKDLSKNGAPKLSQIYAHVVNNTKEGSLSASELTELEWITDFSLLTVREAVKEVFLTTISKGKKVVITTDTYYSKEQIAEILDGFGLTGYDDLFVSCEYGMAKTQGLFGKLFDKYTNKSILHIGDDEYADIEMAKKEGLKTFRLYSASDLFDALGGLGVEDEIISISDRVKMGLFFSDIFNNPFWFDDEERRLSVKDAFDIGYLFCAPMITDFTLWLKESTGNQGYDQILFGARDGYLLDRLFRMIDASGKPYYFHTSRTAAIRAGMESQDDIDYVDSMKYFGSAEEALRVRFGIEVEDADVFNRSVLILEKAKQQRDNYQRYIEKLGVAEGQIAFFDFVAKGTTQMYLQKLFLQHMKGFYFLQLEPEFMADKGLDIEPFYSDGEKNTSAIFDNYYILETMLTAPDPQMIEMDANGTPVYATETRSEQDLRCFDRAQRGIIRYFEEYIRILPVEARMCNKRLDERLLALVNKILILDNDFLSLKVEDPFFGRMTDMRDVL